MSCRINGIGQHIGENLHHRVRVDQRIGQGWIEFVLDLHDLTCRRFGRSPGAIDQCVNIHRLGLGRLIGRQGLHPVEQIDHPLHFRGDHLGQRLLGFVELPVEQLGGASDRGQRILDFMAEYIRCPDREIGRIIIFALEDRTVLRHRGQGYQTPIGIRCQRMNVEIDYSQAAVIAGYHHTAGGQADVPFDQSGIQSRVGEMQNLVNSAADQIFRTGPEQSFARRIHPGYQMLRVDDDQGMAETSKNLICRRESVHQAAALLSQGV